MSNFPRTTGQTEQNNRGAGAVGAKKPVYQVVLNLTGRPQAKSYCIDCLDLTAVSFNYRVINLAELPGQEYLKRGPAGIIPLVSLMRHHLPDEEVLAECARHVEELPNGIG